MKQKLQLPFITGLILFITSCGSYNRVPYFQDVNQKIPSKEAIDNYTSLTVQPEDILGISVSSLNPEASSIFNYNLHTITGTNQTTNNNPVIGYLVDRKGEIQLPLIGNYKVSGQTTSELRENIRKKLLTYLKEPVVNIRILNFKVSVMGDVARPGVYQVQNERITIPEAISLAGDLNITGLRDNVMLIRETNGTREYIPIDLTSKKLFTSPYYYLRSNDVIYVQPGKNKYASVDNTYRNIGILLSAISIVVVLLTR
ncbi:polysaccharide biosynthesis/export family protein [Desertivirga xinjiangensis]|uniref:polysaccharide biosynthesis/export family protein n=1 Tax=Desertivirga xinjiangensis TaxID=539206 RepID=UPI0021088DBA|nr:polysaccharide biosynthesis/export family protein [Pedobacter xinjiangensis]